MKSNMFKSESTNDRFIMEDVTEKEKEKDRHRDGDSLRHRRQQETGSGTRNAFGGKKQLKEKDLGPQLNIENFPELTTKVENQTLKENEYASALSKAKETDKTALYTEKVPQGWVRIKVDDSCKRVVYEYGKINCHQIEKTINVDMNDTIETMKERWRQHKENHIELYGEDEYERCYQQYICTDGETELDCEELDY